MLHSINKKLLSYQEELHEKFRNKTTVKEVIKLLVNIDIQEKDIEIKNKKIILHSSSVIKKEVILYEKKVLKELLNKGLEYLKIL